MKLEVKVSNMLETTFMLTKTITIENLLAYL
jgi:hypothetical protein